MIWQRREIESIRQPSRSSIRTRKFRIGIRASGSAPAESTCRSRSGMRPTNRARRRAEAGEEGVDALPHLLPATEPSPADPDEPDELEAAVDRRDVVIASPADAVDE